MVCKTNESEITELLFQIYPSVVWKNLLYMKRIKNEINIQKLRFCTNCIITLL